MQHNHALDKVGESSLAASVDKYRDKISEISKFGKMADSLVPSEIPSPTKEQSKPVRERKGKTLIMKESKQIKEKITKAPAIKDNEYGTFIKLL